MNADERSIGEHQNLRSLAVRGRRDNLDSVGRLLPGGTLISRHAHIPLQLAIVGLLFFWTGCDQESQGPPQQPVQTQRGSHTMLRPNNPSTGSTTIADPAEAQRQRQRMVQQQLRARDINDQRVLAAMQRVPRHLFVPVDRREHAYEDRPLPIGHQQTISQPYIVALMTQLAQPKEKARALDIGTGSGYQAAVLAELVSEVYGIEIICELADEARQRLTTLGYRNVDVRCGDGYGGWPDHAPFDVIILAAAPDHVPQPLVDQLAPGGRLVLPVGQAFQELLVIEKKADGSLARTRVAGVAFVPMTGEAQDGTRGSKP
jgi:protein-L-isoaspartate(D-aspartate) O-methyltransferase